MNLRSKISVLLCVHNDERYIAEAISSVLNQSYENYELIIIDDCSNDNTSEIIHSFKDDKIRYFKNEENIGLTKSLNRGIELSNGEYIARLDSDDICEKDRFEKQALYLDDNSDVDIVSSFTSIINSEGKIIRKPKYADSHIIIKYSIMFNNPVCHSSVMLRRSMFDNRKYDSNIIYSQDFELWSSLIHDYNVKFGVIAEPLIKYRDHSDSIGNKKNKSQKQYACDVVVSNLKRYVNLDKEHELSIHSMYGLKESVGISDIFNLLSIYNKAHKAFIGKEKLNASERKIICKLRVRKIFSVIKMFGNANLLSKGVI